MKKSLFLLALSAFAPFSATPAQSPRELVAMLPAAGGWKLSSKVETFSRENLFDRINGAADAFLLCNFVEMTAVDYTKDGSDKYITLQMYRHATPADAFAIYAAERSEGPVYMGIGAEGYRDTGLVHFLCGGMYVKVFTSDESPEAAAMMEKIARGLASKIDPKAALPAMLGVFPRENKSPRSETRVVEGFLGHKFLRAAWRAAYKKDGKEYHLFIIDGKTREGVRETLVEYYKFNKQAGAPAEGAFTISDRFNGDIPMLWRGRYLYGVLNEDGADIDTAALLRQLEAAPKP